MTEHQVFHYAYLLWKFYLNNKTENYHQEDVLTLSKMLNINIMVIDIYDKILFASPVNSTIDTVLYTAILLLHNHDYYAVVKNLIQS